MAPPRRLRSAVVSLGLLAALISICAASAALAQSSPGPSLPLITAPINEGDLAVLSGNTRPEAQNPANDRGIVADDLPLPHMLLQLRRPPAQEQALVNLIDQLHDPKSSQFHHWLRPSDVGAQFGPAPADIQTVTGWLQQHGFTVNKVYPNGMVLDFSGTAGQIRTAFHTEIHNLSVNGLAHIANMSDPQIPAALAPAVVGIVSLHDFKPAAAFTGGVCSAYQVISGCYQFTPADLATIYNFNPLFTAGITGQGQTIYLLEDSNIDHEDDWSAFRSLFGLSSYTDATLSTIHPGGCGNPGVDNVNDDFKETALDAEWSSAAAPDAAIVLATCAASNTTGGVMIAIENLIGGGAVPGADIVSISYQVCEAGNTAAANQAIYSAYQTGVADGISIFVAAGDQGADICDAGATYASHGINVNALASTPYNVAVGGTDFADTAFNENGTYWNSQNTKYFGSAKSYIPEIPWNDTCASRTLSAYEGFSTSYGPDGFCNDSSAGESLWEPWAGGGGPSGCATGSPAFGLVVSGTCAGWPKPSWQSGFAGIHNDGVRDLPDVALFAANGPWGHTLAYCVGGSSTCSSNGVPNEWGFGTSADAPIMAGLQALIDQSAGGSQGNPAPRLYALAYLEYGSDGNNSCNSNNGNAVNPKCIFYDIDYGDNDVACQSIQGTDFGATFYDCYVPNTVPVGPTGALSLSNTAYDVAYSPAVGWDFASGIGSVNAANLVGNWVEYCSCLARAAHDFNGDGVSDILWRNTTNGELAAWLMNGGQNAGTILSGADIAQVPSAWSVVGTADFNGDGDADILWLDNAGDLAVWLMNGAALKSGIGLGNVGTQWTVVGTGDFNADGIGDILWRNTATGDLAVWLMSNGQLASSVGLGAVPLTWEVVGTGDFNGDGTTDILWRNQSTGDLSIWLTSNGQFASGIDLGSVPLTWTVVGTGDFNGDGTSDILWRSSSGDLAVWLISNGQMSSGAALAQVPTSWSVAETGDFNGNGTSDILWIDQSGDLAFWLMNGLSVSSYLSAGNVGTTWRVQGQGQHVD